MKNLFVPYEECLELKHLGFDVDNLRLWDNHPLFGIILVDNEDYIRVVKDRFCKAFLYQQVFEWFREKFNIDAWSQPWMCENNFGEEYLPDESYSYYIFRDGEFVKDWGDFLDFDEAQLECVRECIKHIKTLKR